MLAALIFFWFVFFFGYDLSFYSFTFCTTRKNIFVINQEILSTVPKSSLLFGTNEYFWKRGIVSILDSFGNSSKPYPHITTESSYTWIMHRLGCVAEEVNRWAGLRDGHPTRVTCWSHLAPSFPFQSHSCSSIPSPFFSFRIPWVDVCKTESVTTAPAPHPFLSALLYPYNLTPMLPLLQPCAPG